MVPMGWGNGPKWGPKRAIFRVFLVIRDEIAIPSSEQQTGVRPCGDR